MFDIVKKKNLCYNEFGSQCKEIACTARFIFLVFLFESGMKMKKWLPDDSFGRS